MDVWWETLIGLAATLFAATTVFAELKDSLDIIWETPKLQSGTVWTMIRRRLLSFGVVINLGFILLASMLVSAAISALVTRYGVMLGNSAAVVVVLNNVLTTFIVALLFGAIFKLLPERRIPWRVVWHSALLSAILYMMGKSLSAVPGNDGTGFFLWRRRGDCADSGMDVLLGTSFSVWRGAVTPDGVGG